MAKAFKIVITGAFNAGKTQFIATASEIPVVSTERKITDELAEIKDETTVAMDYGQATVNGSLLHLFGTPGQDRFSFMWDILSTDTDLLLVMVDSADRSTFTPARRIMRHLGRKHKVPFLIVANKQDARRAMPPEEVAQSLKIDPPDRVLPCIATDKKSVYAVLAKTLEHLS